MAIKPVLREELLNSQGMLADYERELAALPQGSLIRKSINGHTYYYVVLRDKGRVKFIYKGRSSKDEVASYRKARDLRAKYRRNISRLKRQIRFLKGVLRGKEEL